MRMTLTEQLATYSVPEPNTGCVLWTGPDNGNGYGNTTYLGKTRYAHRLAYENAKGPIPKGLHIDHLCRTRACINPDHLEAVSQRENNLRGNSVMARQARQTHCKNGHPLVPGNLVKSHLSRGERRCRECHCKWMRDRYQANKVKFK